MDDYETGISNPEMDHRNEDDDNQSHESCLHFSSPPEPQPFPDANVHPLDTELLEELYFDAEDNLIQPSSPSQPNQHARNKHKKSAKQGRRKRTCNPFIAFFLSMYSRRPKARAADVARQAGRQWCRMSDRQRQRCAARMLSDWQEKRREDLQK